MNISPATKADFLRSAIDRAGSHLVSVTFVKKDGSERKLTFNAKDHNDVKGTGTPCSNPNIFRVRETIKGQWRSFDAERVLQIRVNGEITKFTQEG